MFYNCRNKLLDGRLLSRAAATPCNDVHDPKFLGCTYALVFRYEAKGAFPQWWIQGKAWRMHFPPAFPSLGFVYMFVCISLKKEYCVKYWTSKKLISEKKKRSSLPLWVNITPTNTSHPLHQKFLDLLLLANSSCIQSPHWYNNPFSRKTLTL